MRNLRLPPRHLHPSRGYYNESRLISRSPGSEVIDIIIPVYNEEDALPGFYEQLAGLPLSIRPIFVDNGSIDNSLGFIRSIEGATVICHGTNKGYGASLRTGIRHSTSDKIIIIDADGEYSPQVIPAIVQALDHFEVVHTSRFLDEQNEKISPIKYYGNRLITTIFNVLFRQRLTDLYTGCKGYRRQCVAPLEMKSDGFEHVLEVSARLVRQTVIIKEVPVCYIERTTGVSKMNHLRETLKYVWLVFYYFLTINKRLGKQLSKQPKQNQT